MTEDPKPVAWLRTEYNGTGRTTVQLEPPPDKLSLRDEFIAVQYAPLYTRATLDIAIAQARREEMERCAIIAVEVAAEAVKRFADDPNPVRQPYANNRLMHVGWNAATAMRALADKPASGEAG